MAAAKLHVVKSWNNASTATHSPQKLNQHQNWKFLKVCISTSHLLLNYLSFRNEWSWPQQDSPHLDDPLGRKHPCPMWMWFHSPAYINSIHAYVHLFSHENESNLILLTLQDHLKCNIRCLEKPGVLISGSADEPAQIIWVDWLPLYPKPKPSCQEEQKTRSETIRKPQYVLQLIFHHISLSPNNGLKISKYPKVGCQGCCREAYSYHTSNTDTSDTSQLHQEFLYTCEKSWTLWTCHDSLLCSSNRTVICGSPTCQSKAKFQAANAKIMPHLGATVRDSFKIPRSNRHKLKTKKSQTWGENI